MAKTVRINTDNTIEIIDIPWTLQGWYEAIGGGCDIVETVKTQRMFDLFRMPVMMLVDEEGHLRGQELNLVPSILYGMGDHGCPIVGNVIFAVPNFESIDPPEDAEGIMRKLIQAYPLLREVNDHVGASV